MKYIQKIRMLEALKAIFILGMTIGFAFSTGCIDFKKTPVTGFITFLLACIGATTVGYHIEKRLWNKYIKKLREKYEQQRAPATNEDHSGN